MNTKQKPGGEGNLRPGLVENPNVSKHSLPSASFQRLGYVIEQRVLPRLPEPETAA